MSDAARLVSVLQDRLNMVLARGVLHATDDGGGGQAMQVSLLADELADSVERFQSFGLSAVPPPGSEVLVGFLGGNRDHGVVLAVNDRGSRRKNLHPGEVVLYSAHDCGVLLDQQGVITIASEQATITVTREGDVTITGGRNVEVEGAENVSVNGGERVVISAGQQIELNAPLVTVRGTPIP